MCRVVAIVPRCLPLAGLTHLFQVQFSREPLVACQQSSDASQAYVVYLVGRRPSGCMSSLPAEQPRDVPFPITSPCYGRVAHSTDVSVLCSHIHSISDRTLRTTELIPAHACSCLLVSIQNHVNPRKFQHQTERRFKTLRQPSPEHQINGTKLRRSRCTVRLSVIERACRYTTDYCFAG